MEINTVNDFPSAEQFNVGCFLTWKNEAFINELRDIYKQVFARAREGHSYLDYEYNNKDFVIPILEVLTSKGYSVVEYKHTFISIKWRQ